MFGIANDIIFTYWDSHDFPLKRVFPLLQDITFYVFLEGLVYLTGNGNACVNPTPPGAALVSSSWALSNPLFNVHVVALRYMGGIPHTPDVCQGVLNLGECST